MNNKELAKIAAFNLLDQAINNIKKTLVAGKELNTAELVSAKQAIDKALALPETDVCANCHRDIEPKEEDYVLLVFSNILQHNHKTLGKTALNIHINGLEVSMCQACAAGIIETANTQIHTFLGKQE